MDTASVVCGIIAIATLCVVYPTMIFAPLSIVFAMLSRGGELTFQPKAKAGLIISSITLALLALMFIYTLFIIYLCYGSIFNIPLDESGYPILDYEMIMNTLMNLME